MISDKYKSVKLTAKKMTVFKDLPVYTYSYTVAKKENWVLILDAKSKQLKREKGSFNFWGSSLNRC